MNENQVNLVTKICLGTSQDSDYRACFKDISSIHNFLFSLEDEVLKAFQIQVIPMYYQRRTEIFKRVREVQVKNANGGIINIISEDETMGFVII